MRSCELDETRAADWDALVSRESEFSLMQSWDWGLFKEQLGWRAHRVAIEQDGVLVAGAQLLVRRFPLGRSMAYVPRGPVGRWREPDVAALLFAELDRISRANGAVFLKLEPAVPADEETLALLERHGFGPSRIANNPRTTIVLDIAAPEQLLLEGMRKETRKYIRRAEREGFEVRAATADDLPAFSGLMLSTARRAGFAARDLHYYQTEWKTCMGDDRGALLLAYRDGELHAARSVHVFGGHSAEFHGCSKSVQGLHPNYLLVWRGIQWAQAHGALTYDFWGIPDEVHSASSGEEPQLPERHDGLWGVYQFKRGFCSNVVRYIGAYDRVYAPTLYRLSEPFMLNRAKRERASAWLDGVASRPRAGQGESSQ